MEQYERMSLPVTHMSGVCPFEDRRFAQWLEAVAVSR
jgi:hypothetical protein